MSTETPHVIATSIPGLYKLERTTYPDNRGFFREVFHQDELLEVSGIDFKPIQLNHSESLPRVIRGLHVEPWNKLVYPVTGQMFAAIADVRPESPTFGKVETFTFGNGNLYAIFVAEGLANSICVTGNVPVEYLYLVDKYYSGKPAVAFAYNDPDLAIKWPVENPIISDRDVNSVTLRQTFPEKYK